MNWSQTIRALFFRNTTELVVGREIELSADSNLIQTLPYDVDAHNARLEAYRAEHALTLARHAEDFLRIHGADFDSFFYHRDVETIIRQEIIPVIDPAGKNNTFFDQDHWKLRHPFNFPGTFYTAESDTCGTGHTAAPDNVLYDAYGCEFIFRQPQNYEQLFSVVDAAGVELLESYSCNGNTRWTYQKCRDWWEGRQEILRQLNSEDVREVNGNRILRYLDYLNGSAEMDLRKYCYFLENGIYPNSDIHTLPLL